MSNQELRLTEESDLDNILQIIDDAKIRLREMGLDQWQNGYPNRDSIMEDQQTGSSYVYYKSNKLVATMAVVVGEDPFYEEIDGNGWLNPDLYAAIHRAAVTETWLGKGIMGELFVYAEEIARSKGAKSVRIDTHPDNLPMKRAIEKQGYTYCGIVRVAEGGERIAYEKMITP